MFGKLECCFVRAGVVWGVVPRNLGVGGGGAVGEFVAVDALAFACRRAAKKSAGASTFTIAAGGFEVDDRGAVDGGGGAAGLGSAETEGGAAKVDGRAT